MLIVPLHRPLTRANLPVATVLLVLANLFVFFVLQSGDHGARIEALRYYVDSGLASRELPAYLAHLDEQRAADARAELDAAPEPLRDMLLAERIAADDAFAARLADGAIEGYDAEWSARRAEYERLRARVFTDRHVLRYGELDLGDALGSAFLHGGVAHLLGNMVFLFLLGLLVEPLLGAARLLALYLLGALGAAAAAWAWHWGESGAMLGASGAVAALMGASSVLWAGRRVRVFYWFVVLFDYVRVPALWLLPAWLGWELLQLAWNSGAGIAFEAHAGGLVSGALLAAGARQIGWWNPAARDEDEAGASAEARLQQALAHLGRLETAQADALLRALALEHDQLAVHAALFRCARLDGDAARAAMRGAAVLTRAARDASERRQQTAVLEEMDGAGLPVAVSARVAVVRRLLAAGEPEPARAALAANAGSAAAEGLAQAWLELGLALHGRGDGRGADAAWRTLSERWPHSPQAGKARFLREAHAAAVDTGG